MVKSNDSKILRPSWIEVDLNAIAENVKQIKNYLRVVKLLAVVKADAYGLGAIPVAKTILENGADMLGVVMLDEAIELRNAGITAPIMNMGPILPEQAKIVVDYRLEQVIFTPEVASALSGLARSKGTSANVHLKIDTGMSRYGISWRNALQEFESLCFPHLNFQSAMTHFPISDAVDKSFALLQIRRFRQIRQRFEQNGHHIPVWHMCNSGGVLDLPQAHMDMVRVGLMIYGYYPSQDVRRPFPLKPAMTVKSKIAALRDLKRGDTVGYGRRFIAEKEEKIAVLPMGYADGYNRRLRNIGQVLLRGRCVPIVGGLCMDAFFIKVTDFPDIQIGETVTLMGCDGDEEISPHDIANWTGTVSYDVLAGFGKRLPRVYLKNGQVIEIRNSLISRL